MGNGVRFVYSQKLDNYNYDDSDSEIHINRLFPSHHTNDPPLATR